MPTSTQTNGALSHELEMHTGYSSTHRPLALAIAPQTPRRHVALPTHPLSPPPFAAAAAGRRRLHFPDRLLSAPAARRPDPSFALFLLFLIGNGALGRGFILLLLLLPRSVIFQEGEGVGGYLGLPRRNIAMISGVIAIAHAL